MSRIACCVAALALAVGGAASRVEAATFTVNPTQIYLTGKSASALLTLRNNSDEAVRFQLSAFAWNQGKAGEIELEPTTDVVFFPALLTLKPGEERKVRVGGVAAAGAREKTYRIFVEELPGVDSTVPGASVRVLTKMGVPIFVRPATERTVAEFDDMAVASGRVHFALANGGTVHVLPQQIKVRALSAGGDALLDHSVAGWYILAGGRREFDVDLPPASCGKVTSVTVETQIDGKSVTRTVQAPAGACAG
jgi:fimbrial chaperone protein